MASGTWGDPNVYTKAETDSTIQQSAAYLDKRTNVSIDTYFVDCNECTTISSVFSTIMGSASFHGVGEVGASETSQLKTLLGVAPLGNYAHADLILLSPWSIMVVASQNNSNTAPSAIKFLSRDSWNPGSRQWQTEWMKFNAV